MTKLKLQNVPKNESPDGIHLMGNRSTNLPAEQKPPRYVTCRCQHCDGHIEFNANELVEENSVVPCPHCGLETILFLPKGTFHESNKQQTNEPRYVTCHCQHCDGKIEFDANLLAAENSIVRCPHCGEETEFHISNVDDSPFKISDQNTASSHRHKRVRFTKGTRVALTTAQCASPIGQELINLLSEIVHDGFDTDGLVTEDGVQRLNAWLDGKADTDIPAIKFLLQISDRILRTGKVTTAKAFEMQRAIERVLPMNIRDGFQENRHGVWLHSSLKPKATEAQLEYIRGLGGTPPLGLNSSEASLLIEQLLENSMPLSEQPATEKQLQFIRDLGENPPAQLTKTAASSLIEELLAKQRKSQSSQQPPTPRQIMVLRFWNRMDLAQSSKWDVEQWLNQFYDEDPRRKAAWETFKSENGDDGSQHDPSWVPIGIGESYLNKIV